jgi:hypothetical protein
MKYLLTAIFVLLATVASAEQYCTWTGTEVGNCVSVNSGVVRLPSGLNVSGGEGNFNSHGYYKLVQTIPSFDPAVEKLSGAIESKAGNEITRDYNVLSKNTTEQNEYKATALSYEMYIVLKWMVAQGVIDPATAPTGLKAAYLARQALGQ